MCFVPVPIAPGFLSGTKAKGNRGWTHTAAMLFHLKALVSALLLSTAVFGAAVERVKDLQKRAQPKGIDVASYQCNVNWNTVAANGISFAYIKATEGTSEHNGMVVVWSADIAFISGYKNPCFSAQYTGATNAGLIRGSYHFARPDISSGATQANYFASNGGGWSGDGITLPGSLDIECKDYSPPKSHVRQLNVDYLLDR